MEAGRMVLAVLFFTALAGLYVFLFLKNRRTPRPEGCEDLRAGCSGCRDVYCPNHPAQES